MYKRTVAAPARRVAPAPGARPVRIARPPRPLRAVPHKACEPGEACHALAARRARLGEVLRDALGLTRELAVIASEAGADANAADRAAHELRHAWDTVAELSAAVARLDARLEDCRAEYDYLNYADADARVGERSYDL